VRDVQPRYLGRAIFALTAPLYWPAAAAGAYYGFMARSMGFGPLIMVIWVGPVLVVLGVAWTIAGVAFAGTLMRERRAVGRVAMALNLATIACGLGALLYLRLH
jgi:hypothetical protein